MKNILFVVWMLAFPLVQLAKEYVHHLIGVKVPGDFLSEAGPVIAYVFIAALLYESEPKKENLNADS